MAELSSSDTRKFENKKERLRKKCARNLWESVNNSIHPTVRVIKASPTFLRALAFSADVRGANLVGLSKIIYERTEKFTR